MEREKKRFFVYTAASADHVMSKIASVDTILFLDKHASINNPCLQSSVIIIFLRKYYMFS